MSQSTSNIERTELRHGLAQILKCYNAGGLKRFNRATAVTVPDELLAQWTASSDTAGTSKNVSDSALPSRTHSASQPVATAPTHMAVAATTHAPASTPIAAPPLELEMPASDASLLGWQLPSMDDATRLGKLDALNEQVKACRKCAELVCYRRQTVFGEGLVRPKVCFFGEAPGADEDAQGRPFVGAAGRLLNDIIRAMRLTREEVYILNSLKCRPPQNRTPLPEEINNCRPYALTQLEILQPEFIILLGAVAVRSVLQTDDSVGRLRGRFHHFHGARVVVTYHPAYLLRTPEAKKLVWSDVQMVMRELKLI